MAIHDVTFSLPERALGKADAKFKIRADGALLGTLAISNGSLVWFPNGNTYGYKMDWAKFHSMMTKHASRYEKR